MTDALGYQLPKLLISPESFVKIHAREALASKHGLSELLRWVRLEMPTILTISVTFPDGKSEIKRVVVQGTDEADRVKNLWCRNRYKQKKLMGGMGQCRVPEERIPNKAYTGFERSFEKRP